MTTYIVNKDNPHGNSLCEKLSTAKENGVIVLSSEEMDLYNSNDFHVLDYKPLKILNESLFCGKSMAENICRDRVARGMDAPLPNQEQGAERCE